MAVPKVVIVGRPNVGKSSLFNWLVGHRVAIVDPTAGVTRDRVTHLLELQTRYLELIDTGGMGIEDHDGLTRQVESQIAFGLNEADLILFVVDAQAGIVPLDDLVLRKLRASRRPVLCIANKADNDKFRQHAESEFSRFGMPLLSVSALGNRNKDRLIHELVRHLPEPTGEQPTSTDVLMKIGVVGKRNAGKSTFINCIAQSERVIVSEVPGTTRDSIDVRFEHNGRPFIAIDTAGVLRRKSVQDPITFYSLARAQRTIRRADVVLLFIDALIPVGKVDKQLAGDVVDQHKPCIFVVNKWDTVNDVATSEFSDYLDRVFPDMKYVPRAFLSAKDGRNVQAVIDLAQSLYNQARERVSTSEVNKVIQDILDRQPPPIRQHRRGRVYFATQIEVAPPTIVIMVNDPNLFDAVYRRFLINRLREIFPFAEVPIKLYFRKRDSHGGPRGNSEEGAPTENQPSSGRDFEESVEDD